MIFSFLFLFLTFLVISFFLSGSLPSYDRAKSNAKRVINKTLNNNYLITHSLSLKHRANLYIS